MIDERAVVESIGADSMEVRVTQPEQCDACAIRESCYGNGNLLTVPREPGIGVHDSVAVSIENASILGLSALVYGLPLAGLLAGIIVGYYGPFATMAETARTLASLGAGLGLLGAAAFVIRFVGRRLTGRIVYRTRRVGDDAAESGNEGPVA